MEVAFYLQALLLSAASSLIASVLFYLAGRIVRRLRSRRSGEPLSSSYAERLAKLTDTLRSSSKEVDETLRELASVATERSAAAQKLEQELAQLSVREKEIQARIAALQNVPLPVAEHFAALTSAGEKRSARRDYLLFALGVLASTVVSLLMLLVQQ